MNRPSPNCEENIKKVVGHRIPEADFWETVRQMQALAIEMHKALKHRWAPKGVYRFKTNEEADEWMNRMLARSQEDNP